MISRCIPVDFGDSVHPREVSSTMAFYLWKVLGEMVKNIHFLRKQMERAKSFFESHYFKIWRGIATITRQERQRGKKYVVVRNSFFQTKVDFNLQEEKGQYEKEDIFTKYCVRSRVVRKKLARMLKIHLEIIVWCFF